MFAQAPQALCEGIEGAGGVAGLGDTIAAADEGGTRREGEPCDGPGFGREVGNTQRNARVAEWNGGDRAGFQQVGRKRAAVDGLRLGRGVDAQDESGDESLGFAGLLGKGVVPDDSLFQVVDERGKGRLTQSGLAESAEDREGGSDRRQSLALDIAEEQPRAVRRCHHLVDVSTHQPVRLHRQVQAVDDHPVGEDRQGPQHLPLESDSRGPDAQQFAFPPDPPVAGHHAQHAEHAGQHHDDPVVVR